MTTPTDSIDDLQETDIQREVRRRRAEYWDREFGPDSEAAKKYEEAMWGTNTDVAGHEA